MFPVHVLIALLANWSHIQYLIKCCCLHRPAVHPRGEGCSCDRTVTAGRVVSGDRGGFLHSDPNRGHPVSACGGGPVRVQDWDRYSYWPKTCNTLLCHRVCQTRQHPERLFPAFVCHHWVNWLPAGWTVQECRYKTNRSGVQLSWTSIFSFLCSMINMKKKTKSTYLSYQKI